LLNPAGCPAAAADLAGCVQIDMDIPMVIDIDIDILIDIDPTSLPSCI